jgi:hypothetical protein
MPTTEFEAFLEIPAEQLIFSRAFWVFDPDLIKDHGF